MAVNGLVIVGHWFLPSLVERTINQTLQLVSAVARPEKKGRRRDERCGNGMRERGKSSGGRGRERKERDRRAIFQAEIRPPGPFLLWRPLTRITVASPATLKRWTSKRGQRREHLPRWREAVSDLYDFVGDWKPSEELLQNLDVPAHPRPRHLGIYAVHLRRPRKTRITEPWRLRDRDFTLVVWKKRIQSLASACCHFCCCKKKMR